MCRSKNYKSQVIHIQICTNNNTIGTNFQHQTLKTSISRPQQVFGSNSSAISTRNRRRLFSACPKTLFFEISARFSSRLEDDQNLYINRGRHGRWLTPLTKGEPHKWAAGWWGQSSGELWTKVLCIPNLSKWGQRNIVQPWQIAKTCQFTCADFSRNKTPDLRIDTLEFDTFAISGRRWHHLHSISFFEFIFVMLFIWWIYG